MPANPTDGAALLAGVDSSLFPLTLTFGNRNLCHVETGEGAPAGQGITLFSVPRKYEAVAAAMVEAVNAAHLLREAER